MSANNKTICPKCKQNRDKAIVTTFVHNVLVVSYDDMLHDLNITNPLQSTLSENYEIHTDEYGVLMIKYDCYCSVCDFEFSYTNYVNVLEDR